MLGPGMRGSTQALAWKPKSRKAYNMSDVRVESYGNVKDGLVGEEGHHVSATHLVSN